MPKVEHPLLALSAYLPENSFEQVALYLQQYKVHLTVTKERQTILGDYRNASNNKNHRITVNGNLNKFSFLITLLHELAHMLAFEQYGNKIYAHGKEWKIIYSKLLADFITRKIFPADIKNALQQSIQSPAASSCAEDSLMRVLRNYDPHKKNFILVEHIKESGSFKTQDGRIFSRHEKLRKRYRCVEVKTGKVYLFSPIHEVMPV